MARISTNPTKRELPRSSAEFTTPQQRALAPRLFTRAEALTILRIGETTLHWLERCGKLKAIRIGSRVLFNATEIERVAGRGASLTEVEKKAAAETERSLRAPRAIEGAQQ